MYIKNKNNIKHKKALIIGLIILAMLIAGVVLAIVFSKKNSDDSAHTTSTAPAAQSNYTNGDSRENASSSTTTQGGATDNHGQSSSSSVDQTTWKTSDSGVITLKRPVSGSALKLGDELSGAAALDKIQYRLVDNAVGVIAQGSLSVVNGDFSGTLQFHAQSKTGLLVVFSFDSQGREINRVEIPVTLQ